VCGYHVVDYADAYNQVSTAARIVWQIEGNMHMAGLVPKRIPTFAALHQTLLDLGAGELVTQGTFYFTVFQFNDLEVIYFYESGCYTGFMHNQCVEILKSEGVIGSEPLLYRVYTTRDTKLRCNFLRQRASSISEKRRASTTASTKNRSAQTFRKKLGQIQIQLGNIKQLLQNAESQGVMKQQFVKVLKFNAQMDKTDHRLV